MRTVLLTRKPGVRKRRRPRDWLGKEAVMVIFRTRSVRWHAVGVARIGYSLVPSYTPLIDSLEVVAWEWARRVKTMKRRKAVAGAGDAMNLAAVESNVFSKLHGLVAHCADIKYDDGQPRQPGWITLKTMGSAWVVECKDPDTTAVLRVVQATLDDALALASVLLESEEAPWEQDKWLQQQKATNARKK